MSTEKKSEEITFFCAAANCNDDYSPFTVPERSEEAPFTF